MKKFSSILLLCSIFIFIGCANKTYTIEIHPKKENTVKRVVLFLDGTANDLKSRTNVSKLFNIIANQDLDNVSLFYNEGVGTGKRYLGALIGWGTRQDVLEAYEFLSMHYNTNSKVSIFGFSRGAYTARILAGMLQTLGIYDLRHLDKQIRQDLILELYALAYKGKNRTKKDIQASASTLINNWQENENIIINHIYPNTNTKSIEVPIEILGIWDTVEALGIVPTKEAIQDKYFGKEDKQEFVNPNKNYYDKICTIKNVFHAISLDDNRAFVFTPIIMTNKRIKENCKNSSEINIKEVVNEVWFSGAHADVGGGYAYKKGEDNTLSGVSLNWMMKNISKVDNKLIKENFTVSENIFATIHNPEKDIKIAYREKNRANILSKYIEKSEYSTIRIHKSVLSRITNNKKYEYKYPWFKDTYFAECFDIKATYVKFLGCKKISIYPIKKQAIKYD